MRMRYWLVADETIPPSGPPRATQADTASGRVERWPLPNGETRGEVLRLEAVAEAEAGRQLGRFLKSALNLMKLEAFASAAWLMFM